MSTGIKQLRDYQAAALAASADRYTAGVTKQLLSAATGAGKTEIFSFLIKEKIGQGKNCLVLAHRDRLVTQAAARIEGIAGRGQVGLVNGDKKDWWTPCVVATVQSAAVEKQLDRAPKFDTIIVDECHRARAPQYAKVIESLLKPGGMLLGVTATPNRTDKKGLIPNVFQEVIYEIGMQELIDRGYLCPVVGKEIRLPIDFTKIKLQTSTEGILDYKPEEIQKAFEEADWLGKITAGWREVASDRRTIIFVPPGVVDGRGCGMAHSLAEYMRLHGINSAAVDGTTKQREQDRIIHEFTNGQIQVLVNVNIFTEGLDIPPIDCVFFARPTTSSIIYSQAIGRGTRLFPGKQNLLVVDVTGITEELAKEGQSLMTLGRVLPTKEQIEDAKQDRLKHARTFLRRLWLKRITLKIENEKIAVYGDIGPRDPKKLREFEDEILWILRERDGIQEPVASSERRAPNTDLLTSDRIEIRDIDFQRAAMRFDWSHDIERRVSTMRHRDQWYSVQRPDPNGKYLCYLNSTEIDSYNTGAEAKAFIERHAAEAEIKRRQILDNPEAAWRSKPASDKQKVLLDKMKIPYAPEITAGHAADLITQAFNRRKRA